MIGILNGLGHDTDTVAGEGLRGQDDAAIWDAPQVSRRLLITQDLDFSDIRKFQPGTHHGVLLVRIPDPGREALMSRIETVFRGFPVSEWERCFVVVTERKIRVRRPR